MQTTPIKSFSAILVTAFVTVAGTLSWTYAVWEAVEAVPAARVAEVDSWKLYADSINQAILDAQPSVPTYVRQQPMSI